MNLYIQYVLKSEGIDAASLFSEIRNLDGELLAEAELVLVDIPESQLAEVDPDALGWRVYPEKEDS